MSRRNITLIIFGGLLVVLLGGLIAWELFPSSFPEREVPQAGGDAANRWGVWIGALCVFGILSFLYRENPFYRVFEHTLLGLGLGFATAFNVKQVIIEQWWKPMAKGFQAILIESVPREPDSIYNACLIFAGMLGLLWYFQFSKKYRWLSRITIGVSVGAAAGLGMKKELLQGVPQITSTFKNVFIRPEVSMHLNNTQRWIVSFENLLILVIVICVLYYFFFSFRRDTALAKAPANMGRFFLMISFGAFFGNTFMTRVVILIDRVRFLLHDWLLAIPQF